MWWYYVRTVYIFLVGSIPTDGRGWYVVKGKMAFIENNFDSPYMQALLDFSFVTDSVLDIATLVPARLDFSRDLSHSRHDLVIQLGLVASF